MAHLKVVDSGKWSGGIPYTSLHCVDKSTHFQPVFLAPAFLCIFFDV